MGSADITLVVLDDPLADFTISGEPLPEDADQALAEIKSWYGCMEQAADQIAAETGQTIKVRWVAGLYDADVPPALEDGEEEAEEDLVWRVHGRARDLWDAAKRTV